MKRELHEAIHGTGVGVGNLTERGREDEAWLPRRAPGERVAVSRRCPLLAGEGSSPPLLQNTGALPQDAPLRVHAISPMYCIPLLRPSAPASSPTMSMKRMVMSSWGRASRAISLGTWGERGGEVRGGIQRVGAGEPGDLLEHLNQG